VGALLMPLNLRFLKWHFVISLKKYVAFVKVIFCAVENNKIMAEVDMYSSLSWMAIVNKSEVWCGNNCKYTYKRCMK
jgi:hypothetical protein